MSITLTVEIPALDRLCGWLESRERAGIVQEIESEIVAKLKEAATNGTPRPKFEEVPVTEDHPWKKEANALREQGTRSREQEKSEPKPEPEPVPKSKPEPKKTIVTLDAVQRAAAQLRDQGQLKAVTDMFPEFGIKKLSDLEGEKLAEFAARLRELMGAKAR